MTSSLVIGCSAGVSSRKSSSGEQFGYPNSPLMEIVIPANKSVSSAYFGMTIHRLVQNPNSFSGTVPFPPFPIHTFRLWEVVGWNTLEPANGQYNRTTMDGTGPKKWIRRRAMGL